MTNDLPGVIQLRAAGVAELAGTSASETELELDLVDPDAWDFLLDHLDRLVGDYAVDYLKWDHNRDLHEAVERQQIQRWTGLLIPPELVGTHVGPEESHTTHRSTYLSFRLATALFGHAGIEWDLTRSTREELDTITRWIALHQELRPLLHSGVTVRADLADDATLLHGVVSGDRKEAVFCWARVATSGAAHAGRDRFPGLDPKRTYVVRVLDGLGAVPAHEIEEPAWFAAARGDGLAMPGSVLTAAGVPLPTLNPAQALVLHLT